MIAFIRLTCEIVCGTMTAERDEKMSEKTGILERCTVYEFWLPDCGGERSDIAKVFLDKKEADEAVRLSDGWGKLTVSENGYFVDRELGVAYKIQKEYDLRTSEKEARLKSLLESMSVTDIEVLKRHFGNK